MSLIRFSRKPTIKFVLEGIAYPSMKAMCRAYNIESNTVKYRIKKGWSLEEAVGIKDKTYSSVFLNGYNRCKGGGYLGERSGNNVVYEGIHYQSVTALAKTFKISPSTVQYRLDHNIDMSLPVIYSKTVKYRGIVYSSIVELCKEFNISRTVANYRLINNIPFESPVRIRS